MNKKFFLITAIVLLSFDYIKSSQDEEKLAKEPESIKILDKELYDNAIAGNLAEVERLLQQGADPDGFMEESTGRTALNWISNVQINRNFLKKIAYKLVQNGADVNSKSSYDSWPLLGSILGNSKNVPYKLLIKAGANINLQDGQGNTILIHYLEIISIINMRNPDLLKQTIKELPRIVNIVLFKTNLEYNLDLVNKKGHNLEYYVNLLPENTRKWMKKAIKKFKQLKARKKAYINESLQRGNVIPDLCNIVHEYLGETSKIINKQPELKEKEEN